jgi:hypothetical protein
MAATATVTGMLSAGRYAKVPRAELRPEVEYLGPNEPGTPQAKVSCYLCYCGYCLLSRRLPQFDSADCRPRSFSVLPRKGGRIFRQGPPNRPFVPIFFGPWDDIKGRMPCFLAPRQAGRRVIDGQGGSEHEGRQTMGSGGRRRGGRRRRTPPRQQVPWLVLGLVFLMALVIGLTRVLPGAG